MRLRAIVYNDPYLVNLYVDAASTGEPVAMIKFLFFPDGTADAIELANSSTHILYDKIAKDTIKALILAFSREGMTYHKFIDVVYEVEKDINEGTKVH